MRKNPFLSVEVALDAATEVLQETLSQFDEEDQPVIRAVVGTLNDMHDKLTGERVKWLRFENGMVRFRVEGRKLVSRCTSTHVVIRSDDGKVHSLPIGEPNVTVDPVKEGE